MIRWLKNLFTKKIKLYCVASTLDENKIYTVVSKKKDAIEYIEKFVINQNKDHYKLWCELHTYKEDNKDVQQRYIDDVLDEQFNEFCVLQVTYDTDGLAMLLRVTQGFNPIGCSYEYPFEHTAMLERLDEDTKEKIFEEFE